MEFLVRHRGQTGMSDPPEISNPLGMSNPPGMSNPQNHTNWGTKARTPQDGARPIDVFGVLCVDLVIFALEC